MIASTPGWRGATLAQGASLPDPKKLFNAQRAGNETRGIDNVAQAKSKY